MGSEKKTKFSFLKSIIVVLSLISFIFCYGCDGGNMGEEKPASVSMKSVSESSWKALSGKRIYFGHQSVGFNIIQGVNEVMKENPLIKLKVVETNNPGDLKEPILAHSRVGKNTDPQSKCDSFAELIEKEFGNKADIAFFKFCFVDITAGSDVEKVFSYYRNTMEHLKKRYPKVTFIHMTVPLTIVQSGVKAWIKEIIGRPIDGYADNFKRCEFNELMKKEYQGKDPIFDLAKIESTYPEGRQLSLEKNGRIFYALIPEFTDDGGHLNAKGRKIVAEQLLFLLSELSK